MKRFAEQFNKQASGIRLKAAERREIKERLLAYMEYHPLPVEMRNPEPLKSTETELVSEPGWTFNFDMAIVRSFAGVFVLILIVAIPMMAERSVPGDVLYPVKVQFNEEVRSSLSISPYAKVEWETERLERRLAEARLLASAGKLTDEVEADVALAVKEHSNNAKASIAKIRETDEDDAAIAEIAFASALAVQSEVLEGHVENEVATEGEVGHSMTAIVNLVSEEKQAAEATQAGTKPSYAKLLGRVELETTKAYELFASVSDIASAEEVSDIERRLSDIERKLNNAIVLHDGQPATEETADVVEEASEVEENEEPIADESQNEVEDSVAEEGELSLEGAEKMAEEVSEDVEALGETEVNEEVKNAPVESEDGATVEPEPVFVDEEAAIKMLREVLVDTQKLISFMTNIDVRNNVSIDELLPVNLTDDEKIKDIKDTLIEVKKIKAELDSVVVSVESGQKFVNGMDKLAWHIESAEVALVDGNLDQAKDLADEAKLIAEDLYVNFDKVKSDGEEEEGVVETAEEELQEPAPESEGTVTEEDVVDEVTVE